jgi:c-di-GMP-binding flagellar brake protein YcgR
MAEAEAKRRSFRLDVNAPVTIRLDEHERQLKVLLVDISEAGCLFRAGVRFETKTRISFMWMGPSREPIAVSGRIVSARMSDPKTAEYGVQFDMPVAQRDLLAHELLEIQRRKAFKPADSGPVKVADGEVGGRAKRSAYRAAVSFPVTVKALKDGHAVQMGGEASDLSEGGLALAIPQELPEGTELELAFTLPLGAVNLGGEEKEILEQTPFGERRVKKMSPVRPFEPVRARARIVKKLGNARNGSPQFGTGFVDVSAFIKEEIARFVHAHQLTQLRKAAATQG